MTNQPYYPAYQQPVPEQPAPQAENPNKKRNMYIGIGVGVAVLLCCCLSLVLVLFVDPFGWGLLSRFTGGVDSPAKAVPADAEVYMGVKSAQPDTRKNRPGVNSLLRCTGRY